MQLILLGYLAFVMFVISKSGQIEMNVDGKPIPEYLSNVFIFILLSLIPAVLGFLVGKY